MARIYGLIFSGFSVKAFAIVAALYMGSMAADYVSSVFSQGSAIGSALDVEAR